MANRKVTDFTSAGALTGEELVPVVRSGNTDNFKTTTAAIAALAGGGSIFVVNLTPLATQTMNGSTYAQFAAAQVLLESDDVEYVDGVDGVSDGYLQFNTNGTYEIQARVVMSGDWPSQGVGGAPSMYGLTANGSDVAKFSRSVYSGAVNDSDVSWSLQLISQMAAAGTMVLGTKAMCYNFESRNVLITAFVITVRKIGDYTP